MKTFVLYALSSLLIIFNSALALKCLKGSGLPLPTLFNKRETCSGDDVCFIHMTLMNAQATYSGGCQPRAACPIISPALIGKRMATYPNLCTECCNTDYCNLQGCGASVISKPTRGSLCFSCPFSVQPSQCSDVTMCKPGNICVARTNPSYPVYFEQNCVPESTCSPTSNVPYCTGGNSSCCTNDFCNELCINGSPQTIAPTISYSERLQQECVKHINDGYFYDSFSNVCVKVVKDVNHTYTRQQAETKCHRDKAELMTITNSDEQDFLLFWIFSHQINDTDYWLSAKTRVTGSHDYFWVDSSPVKYNHWGGIMMGQPDDRRTKDEDCVFLNDKDRYFWHDDRCDARKTGYICELWNVTKDEKVRQCRHLVFNGYFYDASSDMCLKMFQGKNGATYTYQEAVDDCAKNGADLATIDNNSKTDFILRWIFTNHENMTDFWIGARDIHNTSEFYWPNGQKLSYTHWGNPVFPPQVHGQPDEKYGATNENCVYLDYAHAYHWFDEKCQAMKTGFICEIFDNNRTALVDKCRQRLYDGYFYDAYSNMCIKAFASSSGTNRNAAHAKCTSDGADLVIIDNTRKSDFVLEWIFHLKLNGTDFWTGGIDLHSNGRFYWEHTRKPFTYTNWYDVTPVPPEDCVYLNNLDAYNWKTADCHQKTHGFVCQINQYSMGMFSKGLKVEETQ